MTFVGYLAATLAIVAIWLTLHYSHVRKQVLGMLSSDWITVDDIASSTGLSHRQVRTHLSILQEEGYARSNEHGQWSRQW